MANNINMDSIAVSYGCEKADVLANENPTKLVATINELKQQLI
jgi:phosphoglycolate phosphatase